MNKIAIAILALALITVSALAHSGALIQVVVTTTERRDSTTTMAEQKIPIDARTLHPEIQIEIQPRRLRARDWVRQTACLFL